MQLTIKSKELLAHKVFWTPIRDHDGLQITGQRPWTWNAPVEEYIPWRNTKRCIGFDHGHGL